MCFCQVVVDPTRPLPRVPDNRLAVLNLVGGVMKILSSMVTIRTSLRRSANDDTCQKRCFKCVIRSLLCQTPRTLVVWVFLLAGVYRQILRSTEIIATSKNNNNYYAVNNPLSACLLVMDDNHFLIEWLAYHYHSANLRKLVVAIDPKSQTLPLEILGRWKDKMDITVWKDQDYISPNDLESTKKDIARTFTETSPTLIEHRARQRIFYTQCLRTLKQESNKSSSSSSQWTMLVDVDEFVKVNYQDKHAKKNIGSIVQPGSVARALDLLSQPPGTNLRKKLPTWDQLRASPCIPLPRIKFVPEITTATTNSSTEHESFVTQTHHHHARADDQKRNKITKTIIDLSRLSIDDILDVDSIHMPIRQYCSQRNRYYNRQDSLLVVNHYLGNYDQFSYREKDARNSVDSKNVNGRTQQHFEQQLHFGYAPQSDDEIKPWLKGFRDQSLLQGSGRLAPKSWKPNAYLAEANQDKCALLFFGLPRSYGNMVLPSVIENVLKPNARHGCDVFVHYYQQDTEARGRRNEGGKLSTDDILQLQDAVHQVAEEYYQNEYQILPQDSRPPYTPPKVAFVQDTPEAFEERRAPILEKYHNETIVGKKGTIVKKYYPWASRSYQKSSVDNMVKQWHSIESAFLLMDFVANYTNTNAKTKSDRITYTRVGMFRSDVFYVTPIDIASLGSGTNEQKTKLAYDVDNAKFVIPTFANFPVNDRMVYGPYEAVKIWATKRFELMEERASLQEDAGWIMHSEKFLDSTVFPAMERRGYPKVENGEICFLRARVGDSVLLNDCSMKTNSTNPDWASENTAKSQQKRLNLVRDLLHNRNCNLRRTDSNPPTKVITCKT